MNDHERDMFNRRRKFLGSLGALGAAALSGPLIGNAAESATIELPFGNGERTLTSAFPQKKNVILPRRAIFAEKKPHSAPNAPPVAGGPLRRLRPVCPDAERSVLRAVALGEHS